MRLTPAAHAVLVLLGMFWTYASADVYVGVTDGTITSSKSYSCPGGTCSACIANSTINGPVTAFGNSGFGGANTWGFISGTFSAHAILDGIPLSGALLPSGSFFRSRLSTLHTACPGDGNCHGFSCGVDYVIANLSGSLFGAVDTAIDVSTNDAGVGGTYHFAFCNHFVYWGAGCGVVGSSTNQWALHTPGPVRAALLGAGDVAPFSFVGTGATLDKASGPAAVVTMALVNGSPPQSDPALAAILQYWELRTDLSEGDSMAVDVALQYAPLQLRFGIPEDSLSIAQYDSVSNSWHVLPTFVNTTTHQARATVVTRGTRFVLVDPIRVVAVDGPTEMQEVLMSPASPNPARRGFVAKLRMNQAGPVDVTLLDAQGRRALALFNGVLQPGEHLIQCSDEARTLASGVYYLTVKTTGTRTSQSVLLLH